MSKRGRITKAQQKMETAMSGYPHFRDYMSKVPAELANPEYYTKLERNMRDKDPLNLIYPVGDALFVHVFRLVGKPLQYHVVQPVMDEDTTNLYQRVLDKLVEIAYQQQKIDTAEDITPILVNLLNTVVVIDTHGFWGKNLSSKIHLTQEQYDIVKYFLLRERVGYSKLEPLFNDPYLEDIHCTGVGSIKAVHKIFQAVRMNITFSSDIELNKYILETSERVERPVSDARPVVDAVMPDGSRVNFIYGREISREGSSFTVRKFAEVPTSIVEIINFHTMSAEMAAYIWLCLENGMNVFVCGETASGKTTTLNASCAFIKPDDKVYTVENTAEVTIPHDTWQHLVTREAGKDTDVDMFTLLIAALRSRPNYIIVGEIRGAEGNVAFQAMQTGHPVMSTFHAGSVHSMIQRLSGHPIDVPLAFIDNLNVVLIQQAVSMGSHFVRRVTSISEIERFYDVENKVITRQVFSWDSVKDEFRFRGFNNSFILEKKIATKLGFQDVKDIYKELELRKEILEKMWQQKIFNYFDVWDILSRYYKDGKAALPFEM